MKRREFLRSGMAAATGLMLAPRFSLARATAESRRVLIVGAGLSGLVAAYELDRLGFEVTVLEAQARTGGRILTVRDFDDNLYAEAGAARVFRKHELTLRYINEFDLPLIPFYPTEQKFLRLKNEKREAVGWGKFSEATEPVMSLEKPILWRKIRGGNDALPGAFERKLSGKIKLGVPVVKIEQTDADVRATFVEKGKPETLRGDYLVCAIPFTTLRKIEIAPKFPADKMQIVETLAYDSASRVLLQTKRRFWADANLNGFAFGEEFAEIWHSTFGQSGTRGVLQTYLRGDYSLALTKLAPGERIEYALKSLSKLFPEIRADLEKSYAKCWSEDAWAAGAWAHPLPKQSEIIARSENRVFFAGEHASNYTSWMQGASIRLARRRRDKKYAGKIGDAKTMNNLFHLAFPVKNLDESRRFYGEILGCEEGRSSEQWIDFNLFGHQIVAHLAPAAVGVRHRNEVDADHIPVPHFGIVLPMDEFVAFAERLKNSGIEFVIEPKIRFAGEVGEQATMFFLDPSGNALEFKAFADFSQVFAK